uniref:Transmembrane protein 138 n=1 Tax=Equus caballus TaxID=9796 RepID=F6Q3F3_HORSE
MCPWGPKRAAGRCSRPVTTAWCSPCSSCCCPMTSLSIPSRSSCGWLLSSSSCSSLIYRLREARSKLKTTVLNMIFLHSISIRWPARQCSIWTSKTSIQDIAVLFNIIIIFLMFFNTFVFQAGLVNLLFHKFKGTIILTGVYFALSISLHVWVMNLRWKNSKRFVWTDGLQTLFVFQRLAAVLYCYFYKRTAVRLGDPRFYQDSLWLRKEFLQVRR